MKLFSASTSFFVVEIFRFSVSTTICKIFDNSRSHILFFFFAFSSQFALNDGRGGKMFFFLFFCSWLRDSGA